MPGWITVASAVLVGRNAGIFRKEFTNRNRIGGVVRSLIDHLQHVGRPEDRRLTCTPPVPQP